MLQLPPTIRIPAAHEMPHRQDIEILLAKRKTAIIEQGYKLTTNHNPRLSWQFQAEINIHNDHLWLLITTLLKEMPANLYCEYGQVEEEMTSTGYYPKDELLQKLVPFQRELTQDASLQFTLVANQPGLLTELSITSVKYIRFTGHDLTSFTQHMTAFKLGENNSLSFIDEFPWVVEPLRKFDSAARRPEDVIWSLNRVFNVEAEY